MNVLQIVPALKSGGVERGTVDFAKHLMAAGHRSVIVSSGGPLVNDLVDCGVIHYTLAVHRKSIFSVWACIQKLADIIRKEHIQVVHARSRVPAWIAFFACRRERIPMVTTCHGIYNTHFMSKVMGWGKRVIVISHAVSLHMKERFQLPYKRMRLIHRGVNLDEFKNRGVSRSSEHVTVCIIGRITAIKGHSVLIKAMSRVMRVLPHVRLVVVGEAPKRRYQDRLEMLSQRLGIQERIEFLGTRYDVPELLKSIDLLVAPAVGEEAFGRVLIEAGACHVPVIASRIGGIVDVIDDGVNGRLVPAGDVVALAEAIVDVFKNPAKTKQLAQRLSRKVSECFSDRSMFEKTVDVYREVIEEQKILVLKLHALGDVILSIPSIRAIREKYPKAHIAAVVEESARSILRNCPYLDDVFTLERRRGLPRWRQVIRLGMLLAKENFDICIDLQNNRASHLLAYLSGTHTRIGYENGKASFLLNAKVRDFGFSMSPIEHQFQALKILGFTKVDPQLELWSHADDDKRVQDFLQEHWVGENQLLVGLNPAASPNWSTKQWLVPRFAELCDRLSKQNVRVVMVGDASSMTRASEIEALCKSKPINAVGLTRVPEMIALIRRCQAFVTSDSAPMHVASAVGTPFIALFGPTDPRRHVAARERFTIIRKELQCSPCYLRKCPIGHVCMKKITTDEVYDRVMEHLSIPAWAERAV